MPINEWAKLDRLVKHLRLIQCFGSSAVAISRPLIITQQLKCWVMFTFGMRNSLLVLLYCIWSARCSVCASRSGHTLSKTRYLGASSAWPLYGLTASRSYSNQKWWYSLLDVIDTHSLRTQAQISCIGLSMYKPPVDPRGNFGGDMLNRGSSWVWISQKNPPSPWAEWLGRILGLLTEVEMDPSILSQKG